MWHLRVIWFAILIILYEEHSYAFVYTGHSGYGCFAAVAVPLNIPNHNVFVSYNFEAVYGLPQNPKVFIDGAYQPFTTRADTNKNYPNVDVSQNEIMRKESKVARNLLPKLETKKEIKPSALITKRAIYQMIKDKLKMSGVNGEACLLRLICETNSSILGRCNGVLGTILHILIIPSSSAFENLPNKIYKAEYNGAIGDCLSYEESCPRNILDIFSVQIEDFFNIQ